MTRGGASADGGAGPRVLVVAGNSFLNGGDAALALALAGELRRRLPDATITWSTRQPSLAAALPGRKMGQPVQPWAGRTQTFLELLGRLGPDWRVAGSVAWVALLGPAMRAWSLLHRRAPRVALRLLPPALRPIVREIVRADAVVAMPGGYLHSLGRDDVRWMWAATPLVIAHALRVPVVLAPMTIGAFPGRHIGAARRAIRDAALVLLREERSVPWARRCGADPARTVLAADMAWLTEPDAELAPATAAALPSEADGPRIAFAVRAFTFPSAADPEAARVRYLDALAGLADALVERRGARIVFVPQSMGPPVTSLDAARDVVARMRHPEAATVLEIAPVPGQLAAIYARMHLVVGVRMHAGILAMAAGTPCLAIAYSIKHQGIMDAVGLGDLVHPIDALAVPALLASAEHALDTEAELRARLAERVPLQRAAAADAGARIAAIVRDRAARRTRRARKAAAGGTGGGGRRGRRGRKEAAA